MTEKRLNIIKVSEEEQKNQASAQTTLPSRLARKKERQATFERLWLLDPERFNPLRNCMQRERLNRTWELLVAHADLADQKIADIGCGAGVFSRRLSEAGAQVDAVDIAENALKFLKKSPLLGIQPKQDAMPVTLLPDQAYSIVVCTELIAELHPTDYRLFFSELARLVAPDGLVVCSSPIDIYTENGAQRLIQLAQSEFDIVEIVSSYHALHIRLNALFKRPSDYIKASDRPNDRQKEWQARSGPNRWLFRFNTSRLAKLWWTPISWLCAPILSLFKQNRHFLWLLEKICYFIWNESGLSHLIFIAKRRPLVQPTPIAPIERPRKKEIWE